MNTGTPTPSNPPSDPPDERAQLTTFLQWIEPQVEQVLRQAGDMNPTLHVISAQGLHLFSPGPLNEEAEKNEFAGLARLICAAHDARMVVLAMQTWVVQARSDEPLDLHTKPSESPHRKEYLYLMGEARGGIHAHVLLPILRDRRGRFSCLGSNRVELHEPAEGRFAHLLPQSTVTEEVRAFAAAMLEQQGVTFVAVPIPGDQSTAFAA